jgi:hypothetical protein
MTERAREFRGGNDANITYGVPSDGGTQRWAMSPSVRETVASSPVDWSPVPQEAVSTLAVSSSIRSILAAVSPLNCMVEKSPRGLGSANASCRSDPQAIVVPTWTGRRRVSGASARGGCRTRSKLTRSGSASSSSTHGGGQQTWRHTAPAICRSGSQARTRDGCDGTKPRAGLSTTSSSAVPRPTAAQVAVADAGSY